MFDRLVVIRGGGDLGSGVAVRLHRSGFLVAVLESAHPVAVRRTVAFAEAVYEGHAQVEEVEGLRVHELKLALEVIKEGRVPVIVDPQAQLLADLRPYAVVDATMAKGNLGTHRGMAPVVIGLGPGFTAGVDVTLVVETNRGPHLGRVIKHGPAEPNTGIPAPVGGKTESRVLRAPVSGAVSVKARIGQEVDTGDVLAQVAGVDVRAPFPATLRGIVRDGLTVSTGSKIGDVDPRLDASLCYLISDKSLSIAGGVLEAVLWSMKGESP